MSKVKPLRAIRLLTQHGANALRFSVNNGRYYAPLVSRRKAANLRKTAIIEGTYGSFIPNVGGWDPAWDEPKKMYMLKPNKGHLRERTRPKRAEKIDIAMKAMPERIAKYKQELVDRRPKKDIVSMFQRVLTLQKGGGGPGGV